MQPVFQRPLRTTIFWFFMTLAWIALWGCSPKLETNSPNHEKIAPSDLSRIRQLTDHFWQQGFAKLQRLQTQGGNLSISIASFINNPNLSNLNNAQKQWRNTQKQYHQLLPYLFLKHTKLTKLNHLDDFRYKLAAWPIQPGYLDSYGLHLHSGIVNDISLILSKKEVIKQQGLTDSEDVTLGLYAIEFLLWGRQAQATVDAFKQQKEVPLTYAKAGLKQEELPNNRRRQLLSLQLAIFLEDINNITLQWQDHGALGLAFSTLTPIEKQEAIQASVAASLEHIQWLLKKHSNQGLALHINSFAGLREADLAATLDSIVEFYDQKIAPESDLTMALALLPKSFEPTAKDSINTAIQYLIGDDKKLDITQRNTMAFKALSNIFSTNNELNR